MCYTDQGIFLLDKYLIRITCILWLRPRVQAVLTGFINYHAKISFFCLFKQQITDLRGVKYTV